ncbi:MAG: hypothetical protein IPK87_04475 [Planctomycetes bacterium]|nr:hypothetical protein [Planctomycetota bacterium]
MGLSPITEKFGVMVGHGRTLECIAWLEEGMRAIQPTAYHAVLGLDFLHHTNEVAALMTSFFDQCATKGQPAALYAEMNGFDINTDNWHFNLFGYASASTQWDLEWLAHWDYGPSESFTLAGMESVQQAFAQFCNGADRSLGLRMAEAIGLHLVCARFMQLIASGHEQAAKQRDTLSILPVLATAHDWDDVQRTGPATS